MVPLPRKFLLQLHDGRAPIESRKPYTEACPTTDHYRPGLEIQAVIDPLEVGRAMSAVKEEAIRLIQSLPEDCSIEDIQYHLYVRQKVENGLAAVESGRFVVQEDAERRVAEWVKSTGPNPRSTTSETS